jgi:hypothetical protein
MAQHRRLEGIADNAQREGERVQGDQSMPGEDPSGQW